jgi:uncharacterized protein (TIGR03086 family)
MDVVDALQVTFANAHGVIAKVRTDQLDDKTPCTEWSVRDLLEHTIGVVAGMGAAIGGSGSARDHFTLGADPAAQFEGASAATLAGWRTPGVLDRTVDGGPGPMPGRVLAGINLLDTATHTWDIARATGQPAALPDDVARAALEAAHMIIKPEIRAGRFGPEIAAPAGASATDELVAFLGRTP